MCSAAPTRSANSAIRRTITADTSEKSIGTRIVRTPKLGNQVRTDSDSGLVRLPARIDSVGRSSIPVRLADKLNSFMLFYPLKMPSHLAISSLARLIGCSPLKFSSDRREDPASVGLQSEHFVRVAALLSFSWQCAITEKARYCLSSRRFLLPRQESRPVRRNELFRCRLGLRRCSGLLPAVILPFVGN